VKTYLPALLATVLLAACGSSGSSSNNSNNGGAAGTTTTPPGSCLPGQTFPCQCQNGSPSTATCQPDGRSALCYCASTPTGTGGGVIAASGGATSGGAPSGGFGGFGGFGGSVGGSAGIAGTIGSGGTLGDGGSSSGGVAGGGAAGAGGGITPPSGCLMAGGGDYSKTGPYQIAPTKSVDLGTFAQLPSTPTTYTIFYPSNMNDNCPHPVVAWGNGTSVSGSSVYSFFHNALASWGIVVIASDNPNSAGGFQSGVSQDVYLKPAMDYMLMQNADSSSEFFGKLSNDYGTAGHSQGAIAATAATQHPNVRAEAQVEGGGTPKAGIAFLALSGTADTIVGTQAPTSSYQAATGPSLLAIYTGADHTGTPTALGWAQQSPATIGFVRLYTAWFRCYLGGDQTACAVFRGPSCGACSDTNWATFESKNL
jgi:hypothetical protein